MIDNLKIHPQCTNFFQDFLHYIEGNILVIDATCRATSRDIARKLWDMYRSCQTSSDYCCKRSSIHPTTSRTQKMRRTQGRSKGRRKSADSVIAANGACDIATKASGGELRRSSRLTARGKPRAGDDVTTRWPKRQRAKHTK